MAEEKVFKIRDQEFRCLPNQPLSLLRLAVQGAEAGGVIAMNRTFEWVFGVVLPEEHERLNALMSDTEAAVSFEELNAGVAALMAEYSGRPTTRPSRSTTGGAPTPQRSKVVSLSKGTVSEADQSSTAGHSIAS